MKLIKIGFLLLVSVSVFGQSNTFENQYRSFRDSLSRVYLIEEESPLPLFVRDNLDSLPFFDVDPAYRIIARLEKTNTITEEEWIFNPGRRLSEFGKVHFSLNGEDQELIVYSRNDNVLYLPFKDSTNGVDTYSGGRFIYLKNPRTNQIVLDFNKALNPNEAYKGSLRAISVPETNHLDTRINAGIKFMEDPNWNKLDQQPKYPNGNFFKELVSRVKLPKGFEEMDFLFPIVIEAVVEVDGSLTMAKVVQGVNQDLDRRVLRAFNKMSGFIPAMKNGKPVRRRLKFLVESKHFLKSKE